ncbi:hypothetical protein GCM10025865_04180 [Paraoerskovia sediminicola]|uniref:DUF11 domain-containing protein n=1 Tax=Paraoerskovia sediminicola TaxID=1138587 RepID=A0ABM8FZ79_9CELL|nr:hypothetical protein [Paraoerskovia sediminicola]BDZ41119.1 hypothetical protein GCM10025865_04180 [Paraoerskovia sediminicola]
MTNTGESYASPDARVVPTFDADGVPIASGSVDSDSDDSTTTLTAIEVDKSEPSPEGELMRGLHDGFSTVYTLRIRTTDQAGVDGVVVTDYLPAELEFLGCGGVDNSQTVTEEYPGSGGLDATPVVADCVAPDSVETVTDPAPDGGTTYPAGVYTKLTWDLGDLPAGADVSLPYAAGIGLQANVAFPDPAPDAASGLQGANLDNNTGAATQEQSSESSVTNVARVSGDYTGDVEPGTPTTVENEDSVSRSIEDLRIRKDVDPTEFSAGDVATYTITVDASEYAAQGGVKLIDTIPDGVCPLDDQTNYSPSGATCDPDAAYAPTISVAGGPDEPLPYQRVEVLPNGGYAVYFGEIAQLADEQTAVVTYYGRMLDEYEGGPDTGLKTASGDEFTNRVAASATTIPIPGIPDQSTTVNDISDATQTSTGPSLDKKILPRGRLDAGDPCPTDASLYVEADDPGVDAEDLLYRLGDRVCFIVRADFSAETSTRNPVVGDYLPVGTEYEAGSAITTPVNTVATVDFNETEAVAGAVPVWLLGDLTNGIRYVPKGAVFESVVAARVVAPADGTEPEVRGNLVKMRIESNGGAARSYRDSVPFELAPAADVLVTKGVQSVDVPAFSTADPDVDGIEVEEGSHVVFRVDVTNNGSTATGNDFSVRDLDVWDVLPQGIRCTQIGGITNFIDDTGTGPVYGTCTDPGDAGQPPFTLSGVRSAVRWQFPVDPADVDRWQVEFGQTRTLNYTMTIPTPTSAGVTLTNTAAVRSYEAFTNETNVGATYYPADNIDDTVAAAQENAPAATDDSNVFTPGAVVSKSGTTSITESGNNTPSQAVPGELVTYSYAVDIPAQTSVFQATLTDPIPNQLEIVAPAPSGAFIADPTNPVRDTLPAGFSVDADGTLTFPETYTNSTDLTQRFEVTLTTRVKSTVGGQPTLTNTATFRSFDEVGGAPVVTPPASYQVQVRQPAPAVAKVADPTVVRGGDTVEYTLTASNTNNRPPLHDAWLVDCIPAGLTFDAFGPGSGTTLGPDLGADGCAPDEERIAFALDEVLAGGGNAVTRTYTATVDTSAVGGDEYTNTVTLTGSSLDDGTADGPGDTPSTPGDPNERQYSAQDSATVLVPGAGTAKFVTPERATIGETVTYTVVATVPSDTNFYQAAITDQVPAGIDAGSLELQSVTCVGFSGVTDCGATLLPPTGGPDGSTLLGMYVGDVTAAPTTRVLTIRYSGVVADIGSNVAGATIVNQAVARWDNVDLATDPPDPSYAWTNTGITRTATVTVLEPSVTIDKSVSDQTPEPGDRFTYTLDVANATGDLVSPAYNATVSDVVPVGVEVFPTSISNGGSYDPTTRTITWLPADLPGPLDPGASFALSYDATLAESPTITGDPLTNTASLDSYEGLPSGGRTYAGNDSDATVTPDLPLITAVKEATDGPTAYIGDPYTWTITLTNTGTGTAYGVTAVDTLPESWSYVPGSATVTSPDLGSEAREPVLLPAGDPTTATWAALGQLAPNESATVTFQAQPDADVVTTPGVGHAVPQVNSARAIAFDQTAETGSANGPYGGDRATATTYIDAVDLLLEKSHDPTAPVVAGQTLDWTIDVSNQSATDTAAAPIEVSDTLPAGVSFVGATGSGWTCTENAGAVHCARSNAADTLAPGASLPPITVTVAIPADAAEGTTLENSATVSSPTYELVPADNTDTDSVSVTTLADLAIDKNLTGTLVAGTDATYTLDVTNLGPSDSLAPIRVEDTLPAGTTFVSGVGTDWACADQGAGVVRCEYSADLPAGAPAEQLAITVSVPSGTVGDLTNTATVTGSTTDPNPDNDTDSTTDTVTTVADVRIDKRATVDLVAGEDATYELRVDNDGPSDAAGVSITDDLPAGLTFVSALDVEEPGAAPRPRTRPASPATSRATWW